jgi:membrane-bound ClpP family serine protease
MAERARNTLFFVCSVVGAVLLVLGLVAFGRGGDDWWLYLLGAGFSFICLLAPGARIKRSVRPPDA